MQKIHLGLLFFLLLTSVGAQTQPLPPVKIIPPQGVEIPAADRTELAAGVAALGKEIDTLKIELKDKPQLLALLPDVQIFYNAVHYALKYNEILNLKEIPLAKAQLQQGIARAKELRAGKPSWTAQTGLVVRGYVSKIDGSVQPYGLVVPPTYQTNLPFQYRLDVWYRGRSETMTEINFIADRQKNPGQFTPTNAFVLHPYGRYCNANKFAGEVDTFEALDHLRKNYPIDENRISVRGFSMGGAATWHIAAHHAGLWAAAAPGAGFAETPEYLKINLQRSPIYKQEVLADGTIPWYEQKLWHLYNATDYAANFYNLPVVAYSGENDRQKQAADVMARELKKEGIELTHIIGPKTEHKYHPDSIPEINRRVDSIVAKGRNPIPLHVKFTTHTLRYNKMFWVTMDGLEQHWEKATVDAEIKDATTIEVKTKNISAFTLEMSAGLCPLEMSKNLTVMVDDQKIATPGVQSDRSWKTYFEKKASKWVVKEKRERVARKKYSFLNDTDSVDKIFEYPDFKGGASHDMLARWEIEHVKKPGIQGPIDDAFMDSFIFVRPTGKSSNEAINAWVNTEMNRAITQWRSLFRGEVIIKADNELTVGDIEQSNLILWGDVTSNKLLARLTKLVDNFPISWTSEKIRIGTQNYSSSSHILTLIYPNPLNKDRYIVLNSGFTFREADSLTNARQVPRLPDWAVVDITTPPSEKSIGKVVNAGFFGEKWELK